MGKQEGAWSGEVRSKIGSWGRGAPGSVLPTKGIHLPTTPFSCTSDTCGCIKKPEAKSPGHSFFMFSINETNHFGKENQPEHKETFLNILRSFLSVLDHFGH